MRVNFLNKKTIIVLYSLITLSIIFSGGYYLKNIIFFDNFKIGVFQNNQNISDQFEVIGISFFNRESKLNFDKDFWKNTKEWYFKEIKIIPKKSLQHDSSFTLKFINDINTSQNYYYQSFQNPIILNTNKSIKLSNQFLFFTKTFIISTIDEINPLIIFLFLFYLFYYVLKPKKETPKAIKFSENQIFIFSIIIFTFFLSIIIYLSQYLFPCGEDMVITRDLLSNKNPIYYYYTKLDARYFTNFLYQFLNPLYYNLPLLIFKLIPSALVLSFVISIYYFNKMFCKSIKTNISYSLLIVVVFFLFVPNIPISLFFMGASYHYTVFIILFINLLTRFFKYTYHKTLFNAIILSLLFILFLGSNEFSLIISFLLIIGIVVSEIKNDKKVKISTLLVVFTYFTFTLIVVLAQGNYNRMESESGSWFFTIPIWSKTFYLSSRLFADNILFVKNIFTEKSFLVIVAFFWLGFSINSRLILPRLITNIKKIITTYLFTIFFILFVFPLPFYLSGVWSKNPYGFYSQYYHNIQFFLLILTNFIFLKLISEKYQKHALIQSIQSFVYQKKMFLFLIIALILSKSLLTDTTIDLINNSLPLHYEELKNNESRLTKKNNLSVINVYETKHKALTVGGHDYYIRNSIIGEAYIEDHSFKTINGINSMGDTTYRNEHLKNDIMFNINKKSKFIKKQLSLFNFQNKNQIKIIKNITLYNPEENFIESYFIGINYSQFDTTQANIHYTLENNKGTSIATFNTPIDVCSPIFFKVHTYQPNIKNNTDRYLIYLCYRGELKQNYKINMNSKSNSM